MTVNAVPTDQLAYIKAGGQISASQYNGIVNSVKRALFNPEPIETDAFKNVNLETDVQIPEYSVIAVKPESVATSVEQPEAKAEQFSSASSDALFTNLHYEITANTKFKAKILGVNEYHLLAYSGTAPAIGDEIGPVTGKWTVESTGSGFIVINDPDTTNSLVWVLRIPGIGTAESVLLGRPVDDGDPTQTKDHNPDNNAWQSYRTYKFSDVPDADPEALPIDKVVKAKNFGLETFSANVWHMLLPMPAEDPMLKHAAFPLETEPCPEPGGTVVPVDNS